MAQVTIESEVEEENLETSVSTKKSADLDQIDQKLVRRRQLERNFCFTRFFFHQTLNQQGECLDMETLSRSSNSEVDEFKSEN